MKRNSLILFVIAGIVLTIGWIIGQSLISAQVAQRTTTAALSSVGPAFTYQGRLEDNGVAANGTYDFQFSLYNATANGAQIGTIIAEMLLVNDGLFTVSLDFGEDSFNGDARFLEIAVKLNGSGGYTMLTPRQPISAAPYASYADKVQPVGNIVVVAKSGGDFDDISDALASITDASATNTYLIRIAPGIFTENDGIDLKSHVSIEGSGEGVTIIRGDGSDGSPYSDGASATVRAGNTTAELRHLTVESVATVYANSVAIRTSAATNALVLKHITAIGSGGSSQTYGIMNVASSPLLEDVHAQAAATTDNSFAIYNYFNSSPMMRYVTAESTSGTTSSGIRNQLNSNPIMIDVNASGTGGTFASYGLETYQDTAATVIIHDSTFAGTTNSIRNQTFYTMTPPMITLVSSRVDGPVGVYHTCHDSYTATGQALDATCRPIPCVGTYYIDRVSEVFYPGGGITQTNQSYDLWTFAQDGTFQATHVYSGTDTFFDAGRQGAWSTKADGTVAATFLGLEEYGQYNTILRYDADVTFTADCSATEAVDLSLRLYNPTSENPLDPTASPDIWQNANIYITGTLITTP